MKQGHLFLISGPSGVGKNTIINHILQNFPNFIIIPSYTTRPSRPEDNIDKNRISVKPESFQKMIDNQKLIEWKKIHCWLYGKLKKDFDSALGEGKNIILEIDVQGLGDYKKHFPNLTSIFIQYENLELLKKRISKNRPECNEDEINLRYQTALNEMEYIPKYDYTITNIEGKPEIAISKVSEIISRTLAK